MRKVLKFTAAALALGLTTPAVAQDADASSGKVQAELDKFAGMMGGLFQAEPLTAEQESRLPAAQAVVGAMMPDGFYAEMMGDMMDKMLRPMMGAFARPEFILGARLDIEPEAIEALDEAEQVEAVEMLDPAYDRRIDAIVDVMTGRMGGMFAAMEGPMRDGLAKAYAVRFNDAQLADIAAFFATSTGSEYARESMALFSDPQVMQASMQALPTMMSGFGDMEGAMKEAMSSLPKERGYADLSSAERARLAALLGIDASDLSAVVKPPSAKDGAN